MFVLKNFKNTIGRPMGGQAIVVIFFFKFATRSMAEKKMKGGLSPPHGRQGPVAQPRGDRVPPPYISPGRHCLVI